MLLGNFKLKQEWNNIAHISEQRKSRTLTTPNAGEDMEKKELLGLPKAVQWLRLHFQCRGLGLDP